MQRLLNAFNLLFKNNRNRSPHNKTLPLTLYSIGSFRSLHQFLFLDIIEKIKENIIISKVLITFENFMENGAFALWSKCSIFHNRCKYISFQR